MLLPEQIHHTSQTTLEVVGPFKLSCVDRNFAIKGDLKVCGLELVVLHIGNANAKRLGVAGGRCSRDSEEGVSGDGHRQHRVQRVVNVLSNDIYSSRRASDKGSSMAVGGLKLGEEVVPSRSLFSERILRIDVAQGVGNRDRARHVED
ncbi:hypothetical protein HG531_000623 [Fusarium graminearum]|nr:hypothetical protein HG531_000623 [Fusarium graminearum]